MVRVAVLDYGMGNLRSVIKAIEKVAPQARVELAHDAAAIGRADRVVFPGQGAMRGCMEALSGGALHEAVVRAARERPFLGICLGLQALYASSEEGGGVAGLGFLQGRVSQLQGVHDLAGRPLKVPHMGWNEVQQTRPHPLWRGIAQNARFYFVHSYYAPDPEAPWSCGQTTYGVAFTSAAAYENIFAVQFHPEKSQQAGLRLLQNFVMWDGRNSAC